MYFKHNIHQNLYIYLIFFKISYEQSSWVRGENTSLLTRSAVDGSGSFAELQHFARLSKTFLVGWWVVGACLGVVGR